MKKRKYNNNTQRSGRIEKEGFKRWGTMKRGPIIINCTDLQVEIQPVAFDDLANTIRAESSEKSKKGL